MTTTSPPRRPALSILMYHQVGDFRRPASHKACFCDTRRFRAQMRFLPRMGYRVIGLDQALAGLFQGAALPRRPVVLTFDDGTRDLHEHALPILRELAYPPTVFPVSGLLGRSAEFVTYRPVPRLVSAETLRADHDAGVQVGSHTVTHPRLTQLEPEAVGRELADKSARPAVHDSITQVRRSWELSTRALRLQHERGVRTIVKTPVMVENVREIDDLAALAGEVGADFRYDITVTPKNSGALDPLRHRVGYADLVDFMRRKIEPGLWLKRTAAADRPTCGIAQRALQIDPYGNVLPCMEARFTVGNLRERPLSELWHDSPLWSEIGDLTLEGLPVCRATVNCSTSIKCCSDCLCVVNLTVY